MSSGRPLRSQVGQPALLQRLLPHHQLRAAGPKIVIRLSTALETAEYDLILLAQPGNRGDGRLQQTVDGYRLLRWVHHVDVTGAHGRGQSLVV